MTFARRRLDLHVRDEALVVFGEPAEIVLKPEADRKPRRIGRKAQHAEAHALGQFRRDLFQREALANAFEDVTNLA